jgi:hypothetical protein
MVNLVRLLWQLVVDWLHIHNSMRLELGLRMQMRLKYLLKCWAVVGMVVAVKVGAKAKREPSSTLLHQAHAP